MFSVLCWTQWRCWSDTGKKTVPCPCSFRQILSDLSTNGTVTAILLLQCLVSWVPQLLLSSVSMFQIIWLVYTEDVYAINFSDGNLILLQSKTMDADKSIAISHSDCSGQVSVTDINSRCRRFTCVLVTHLHLTFYKSQLWTNVK